MNDVPYEEACRLLAEPQRCEDAPEWAPEKQQPGTWKVTVGVLDKDGIHSSLLVELVYRSNRKTGLTWYKFTVFLRHSWGVERVYQLDARQSTRPIADAHSRPHEHFGAKNRIEGDKSWNVWEIRDALQHFSRRTKIEFFPPVQHPEHFELRG